MGKGNGRIRSTSIASAGFDQDNLFKTISEPAKELLPKSSQRVLRQSTPKYCFECTTVCPAHRITWCDINGNTLRADGECMQKENEFYNYVANLGTERS